MSVDLERCAVEVWPDASGENTYRCTRKARAVVRTRSTPPWRFGLCWQHEPRTLRVGAWLIHNNPAMSTWFASSSLVIDDQRDHERDHGGAA